MGKTERVNWHTNKDHKISTKVVFCGSFVPFHKGHLFVLKECLKEFEFVYLLVCQNEQKPANDLDAIALKLQKQLNRINIDHSRVLILVNKGLTANYVKRLDTNIIARGYRNKKDKKYEEWLRNQYLSMNQDLKFIYFKSPFRLKYKRSSKLR